MESALKKPSFFYLTLIFLVGVLIFSPSFSSALYGDEWKILWLGEAAIKTSGNILNQQSTDLSYLFEIIIFNFFSKVVGYDGTFYYLFSFLTKMVASFSFFWFLRKIKLSHIASFLGSLMFMVTPIGIETTDWVRNFDSYLSIPPFLLALYLSLNLKTKHDSLKIFLLLSIITLINTTRSHGIILTIVGVLIVRSLFVKSYRKVSLLTCFLITTIYLVVSTTPIFGGQLGGLFQDFNLPTFIISFLGNFGNSLVPNLKYQLTSFLLINIFIFFWNKHLFPKERMKLLIFVFLYILIVALLAIYLTQTPNDFTKSIYIGTFLFFLLVFYLKMEFKKRLFSDLPKTSLILILGFSFMLMPLIRNPLIHASSEHRYLIFSSLAIPLLISLVINRYAKIKRKINYFLLAPTLILISIFSLQTFNYLKLQNSAHDISYSNKVWPKLIQVFDKYNLPKDQKLSVIILTDQKTYPKVNSSIAFGFNFHYGVIYKIWNAEELPHVWVVVDAPLTKEYIPAVLLAPDRKILVFEVKGENVKDFTPTARL